MNKASSSIGPHYYISASTAYMREEAKETSPGVSTAKFAQEIGLLETSRQWVLIRTLDDGYKGWVEYTDTCKKETSYIDEKTTVAKVTRCKAHLYGEKDTVKGNIRELPYGVRLNVKVEKETDRWYEVAMPNGKVGYIQSGDVELNPKKLSKAEAVNLAKELTKKDIPFEWGGSTTFGFDCSGFVQMIYQEMGVNLPRDSKDQYKSNLLKPINLSELEAGDLVFFGTPDKATDANEKGIEYCALYLGNDEIAHCGVSERKPWLRISSLKEPMWDGTSAVLDGGKPRLPFREAKRISLADL